MNCDSCRNNIGVERVENNIMLCAYCRYDPKKYEDDVAIKVRKRKKKPVVSVAVRPKEVFYKQKYAKFGCCFYCKKKVPFNEITVDHYRPKCYGGKYSDNRLFACKFCNNLKSNLSIDEFRDKLLIHLKRKTTNKEYISQAINTCSLILNNFIKPPLF